jgi:hypothetical protein
LHAPSGENRAAIRRADESPNVNWIASQATTLLAAFVRHFFMGVRTMDASTEFRHVDLDTQDSRPRQSPQVVEFDDVDSIDPLTLANLLATNGRRLKPPEAEPADAIEIELTTEQMDVVLQDRWVP